MLRRQFMQLISVGIAAFVGLFVAQVRAESGTASLRETLEKGLRARRPIEFEFIDEVVDLVDTGELTRQLVMSCFEYARRRDRYQPYRYFAPAIRIQAKKIGVDL
ncbi:hypothetical protein [Blastopirellula marina]|uniref:Uncharacterized protein n=1 Tax=Blastopirellula marina DSM 3645 TaxID=314230 RepID=A3ZRG9_9BACT|nr:hypothetical protein [Blastopirellula marina]EAQ80738.1 hypothetical protein DSM3645_11996 [Blastopirellula marina DSM 3645]